MANDKVDELFGEGGNVPVARTAPAIALAVGGLLVAVVGMLCLAAPGGVLVLLGLGWIDRELERVDNGYLPPDARPQVERARRVVIASLLLVIGLLVVQAGLYCGGFYQTLGDLAFSLLSSFLTP